MNLFIIPGNPPARHFYEVWAKEIQAAFPHAVVGIARYLDLPYAMNSERFFAELLAAQARELATFCQSAGGPVHVIGHSLGGWMAYHLLEHHGDLMDTCFLLYPFLKRPSLKGRVILSVVRRLRQIPRADQVVVGMRRFVEPFVNELRFVRDEELRSSLTLAFHEYHMIGSRIRLPPFSPHQRQRLHLISCARDIWCPEDVIDELAQSMSHKKNLGSHGFVVSSQERAMVLAHISAVLQERSKKPRPARTLYTTD